MRKRFDIVIAGGGMVGLTIASLLAQTAEHAEYRVTLIDAGSQPSFNADEDVSLRVSAIASGSSAVFSQIGVWDKIVTARVCPYRKMNVWDASEFVDGPETLRFDAADFAVSQLGFIVENVLIQDALLKGLSGSDVDCCYGTKIESVKPVADRYAITLDSGEELRPDLIVGADGARSLVREQAGIAIRSWPYPQKAFVTHLQPAESHANTAWQRFLKTGPIGLLPLADGRVSTVWSTTPEQADKALAADDATLRSMLAEATGRVLGDLQPAGPRGAFPLQALHAEKYVLPGLALVGDAAHAVHPLAGQGANLGIADAVALASVIVDAVEKNENPGDLPALRRYERARKGDNQTMLHFVDGLNRLFSNDSATLARLRGSGMRLFNKSGPIRQRAVYTALGLNQ